MGNWKKWAGLSGLALAGLGTAWLGIKRSENGLKRHYFKLPGDGKSNESVPVLAFEPGNARADSPVVLVAHGYSGSKEIMQFFGSAISRSGIRAFLADLPGHGASQARIDPPLQDFSNIVMKNVEQLERLYSYVRQKFPAAHIATLGHSMGSGAVLNFAAGKPELAATIPVSMAGRQPGNRTNPKNLLFLTGERDIPICLSSVGEIYERTAGKAPEGTQNFTGNFENGSARGLIYMPGMNHISILMSPATMREVTGWLRKSFGMSNNNPLYKDSRLKWTGLGMAAAYSAFFPFSRFLTDLFPVKEKTGTPENENLPVGISSHARATALLIATTFVGTLASVKIKMPHLVPVQLGDFLLALFGISGLAAWIGLSRLTTKEPGWQTISAAAGGTLSNKIYNWGILPLGLWTFVYATLGCFSNRSWNNFKLTAKRTRAMAILAAAMLPYFLASERVFRRMPVWLGSIASLVTKYSLLAGLVMSVYLNQELTFLVMLVAPLGLSFSMFELYSAWQYRTGKDFVTTAVFQSLVFAWIISVIFPLQ